jgi:hypothetical protein
MPKIKRILTFSDSLPTASPPYENVVQDQKTKAWRVEKTGNTSVPICHRPGETGNQAGNLCQTAQPRDNASPAVELTVRRTWLNAVDVF